MARTVKSGSMSIQEEHIAFYLEIGMTITMWANAERALYGVVAACVGKRSAAAVGEAFFAIANFSSKLAFADALVTSKVTDSGMLANWAALEKEMGAASRRRNNVAHHFALGYPEGGIGARYALLPWRPKDRTQKRYGSAPPGESMGVFDIADLRGRIFTLIMNLDNLAAQIARKPRPFPRAVAKERPPATAAQILALLKMVGG